MIIATVGWAQTWNISGEYRYGILRTTDGGVHWNLVLKSTPTEDEGKGFTALYTDFCSETVATVLAPEYDAATQTHQSRIYHTSDGGQTWQNAVVKARHLLTSATFVDARHGWFFGTEGFPGVDPTSAYIGQSMVLYRTTDGGSTWQKIGSGPATNQTGQTTDDGYGIEPLTASSRMQFITASTGWLAGYTQRKDMSSHSWLYVTRDGGATWQKVALSLPSSNASYGLPRFFTEQDGLLLVSTSGPAPQYQPSISPYITHDGGTTWTPSGVTVPFDISNAVYSDLNHAWLPSSDPDRTFYTTGDGWRHWQKKQMNITYQHINGFDFVSPTVGWAIGDNRKNFFPEPGGGLRKGDVIYLLKTTNGGVNWQEIARSQL
jgi:photosystem II stability/assembly factor-like uncharacterized protein